MKNLKESLAQFENAKRRSIATKTIINHCSGMTKGQAVDLLMRLGSVSSVDEL